jgi:hypothetical protein
MDLVRHWDKSVQAVFLIPDPIYRCRVEQAAYALENQPMYNTRLEDFDGNGLKDFLYIRALSAREWNFNRVELNYSRPVGLVGQRYRSWAAGETMLLEWQVDAATVGQTLTFELWRDGARVATLGQAVASAETGLKTVTLPTGLLPGEGWSVRAVGEGNPPYSDTMAFILSDTRNGVPSGAWMLFE